MPKVNKPDKKHNQQNAAHFTEEAQTLSKQNAAEFPPSLNQISKNKS
ncbi:hypothetical protein [Paenibacillus roseipurpureus]|uniref:Uncharacterized protein n=1 Tax=Paenibacillus roseopurpureus TaxID=2918901 RepID=A0AA96RHX5_9BACL|nr:hypothetical protein [Paenibacillus sp. MBLB1832]WNR42170.1 hypothetical protein MJB10_13585 [Paenibacillus sp. MBLB1832]